MNRPGVTLIELGVVLSIILLFSAVAAPPLVGLQEEARFRAFRVAWLAHLTMARRTAQVLEVPVRIELDRGSRFVLEAQLGSGWETLQTLPNLPEGLDLALPERSLNHPTQGSEIRDPISSTHAPYLIFSARGSSSATVVFSDRGGRSLCTVLSSRTGRFRVFSARDGPWLSDY